MSALELAQQLNIIYPSNEIYNYPAGFYNYGPIGLRIKNKIIDLWRKHFIYKNNFIEIETTIVTPEIVLKASGHYESFTDPLVKCKSCGKIYRADKLAEAQNLPWNNDVINHLRCECGEKFDKIENVNLMFKTGIGYDQDPAYLRPETAQGIFVDYSRLANRIPIAIAQVGKSFRNEISPRQGLLRLREFYQMEIEYFFEKPEFPGFDRYANKTFRLKIDNQIKEYKAKEFLEIMDNEIMAAFLAMEWEFYTKLGIKEDSMWIRMLNKDEVPHYSKGNFDVEVQTQYGIIEIAGNAYRTNYDLSRHKQYSGKNLKVVNVVEASLGLERLFYVILEQSYSKDRFNFPEPIKPYKAGLFSLTNEDLSWVNEMFDYELYYMDWKGEAIKKINKAMQYGIDKFIIKDLEGFTFYDGKNRRMKLEDIKLLMANR
jgi:glycyl-tRNA synthetase